MGDDPGAARAGRGDPMIQLRGVTKTFGSGAASFQALRGVDFDVAAGDFVAVMGPSGSGKSTMMNILGCLDVPTAGEFLFKGFHVEKLTRDERALLRRRYLGFVFQGFNLLARTNALENVELPLLYRGEKPRARRAAAMDALAQVGLADWWDHTPAELSGGQQQRVAIARAIVTSPQVLLADEPTGNLDTARSLEIMELLTRFNRTGITILMVTHEAEMAAYAHTVAHVRDGLVEQSEARGAMSMLGPTLVLALREIRRHVLRSFLTVLGIVIGVAAVVTMVTLGNGATAAVREQISGLGVNILQIRPGQGFGRGGGGPAPADFDMDDVAAIRDQVAGVVVVAPLSQSSGTAVRNAANWSTTINGTTSDYFTAQQWDTASGRTFTAAEEQAGKAVCVIGIDRAAQPVPRGRPAGPALPPRNLSCEVIGTLVTRGPGRLRQRPGRCRADADQDRAAAHDRQPQRPADDGEGRPGLRHGGRDGLDPVVAARTPQHPRREAGRFQHLRHRADLADAAGHHAHPHLAARRRRGGQPARRRHRHHEHHAGVGDRADARDRHPARDRRRRTRGAAAVPGGGHRAGLPRRRHRPAAGPGRQLGAGAAAAGAVPVRRPRSTPSPSSSRR